MGNSDSTKTVRSIAAIEKDLLNAQDSFADAEKRYILARQDCDAALDRTNEHQTELDEAIADMRKRSVRGSMWRLQVDGADVPLVLQAEDIANGQEIARSEEITQEEDTNDRDLARLISPSADKAIDTQFKKLSSTRHSTRGSTVEIEEWGIVQDIRPKG